MGVFHDGDVCGEVGDGFTTCVWWVRREGCWDTGCEIVGELGVKMGKSVDLVVMLWGIACINMIEIVLPYVHTHHTHNYHQTDGEIEN
jgi:uncharacterized membrane protein